MIENSSAAFWALVDDIGWEEQIKNVDTMRDIDFDWVRLSMMWKLTPGDIEWAEESLRARTNELADAAEDSSGYVSRDGFWDTINHIVGLGRESFEKALENPDLIYDRYQAGEYTECFSYAFPDLLDYKYITGKPFVSRSKDIVETYGDYTMSDRLSEEYKSHARVVYNTFRNQSVLKVSSHDRYLNEKEKAVQAAEALEDVTNKWAVLNFFSDFESYYIPIYRDWSSKPLLSFPALSNFQTEQL